MNRTSEEPVSLKVYSAESGLYLGITPLILQLKKNKNSNHRERLSLLVLDDCYPLQWQLIEVENWAKTDSESRTPFYINNVRFEVQKQAACP